MPLFHNISKFGCYLDKLNVKYHLSCHDLTEVSIQLAISCKLRTTEQTSSLEPPFYLQVKF